MNLTSHHLVASSEAVLRSSLTLSRTDSLKLVARKLTSVVPLPHKQLGGPAWQSGEIEVCLTSLPLPYLLILGAQIQPLPPFNPDHGLPGVSAGERSFRFSRKGKAAVKTDKGGGRGTRPESLGLKWVCWKLTEALGYTQRVQERPGRDTTPEELCSTYRPHLVRP